MAVLWTLHVCEHACIHTDTHTEVQTPDATSFLGVVLGTTRPVKPLHDWPSIPQLLSTHCVPEREEM